MENKQINNQSTQWGRAPGKSWAKAGWQKPPGQENPVPEKQAPRRKPDDRLDPRSPGSGPGPKAALNR